MSNFDTAVLTVLKREGGFVDDPDDKGGATNFGISLSFLKTVNPNASLAMIRDMTQEEAIGIYKEWFWDNYGYSRILDQSIATKVFDACVNIGDHWANICLQRAVLAATGVELKQDGILGDKTLSQLNNDINVTALLCAYRSELAGFYRSLKNSKYEQGWLRRAYDIC